MHHLIVVHEFGNYTKGQKITDQAEIETILAGHNHTCIVKIAAPQESADQAPISFIDPVE